MFDFTSILIVFSFLLIAVVFLVAGLVLRSKIIKETERVLDGSSNDPTNDALSIIERIKRLLWFFGITYVALALAVFLEGAWGMLDEPIIDGLFMVAGVVLFLFGVIMTAYGIVAMFNTNEKKFGALRKSVLATICNISNGKKLLVLVPSGSFGAEALQNVQNMGADSIAMFHKAGGKALDFCVVDDATPYKIGMQYLVYSSVLRVKYKGITMAFATNNAFDASVVTMEAPKAEQKAAQPVVAQKAEPAQKVEAKPAKEPVAKQKTVAKKPAQKKAEKVKQSPKAVPAKKETTQKEAKAVKVETKAKVAPKKAEPKKQKTESAKQKAAKPAKTTVKTTTDKNKKVTSITINLAE